MDILQECIMGFQDLSSWEIQTYTETYWNSSALYILELILSAGFSIWSYSKFQYLK